MRTISVSAARRLPIAIFCWVTALFAWLASSPFAFQEFIRPRMFYTGLFGDWHAWLYVAWLALTTTDVAIAIHERGPARTLAVLFLVVWGAVGIGLVIHPVLPTLRDGPMSVIVGIGALIPLLWLSAIDHVRAWPSLPRSAGPSDEGRLFVAAVGTAVFIVIVSALLTPIAIGGELEPDLLTAGLAAGLGWNLVDHLVIFGAAFVVLALAERWSLLLHRGFGGQERAAWTTQYAVFFVLFTGAIALVVRRTVAEALGMTGAPAALVAVAAASSIVATWGGLRLRRAIRSGAGGLSTLDVFFGPPDQTPLNRPRLIWFAVLAALIYAVGALSRVIDWDFLLLECGMFAVSGFTFSHAMRVAPKGVRAQALIVASVCLIPLGVHAASEWRPSIVPRHTLDRYASYNPAFRAADAALVGDTSAMPSFDRFLRENTGLPDAGVQPVDLNFVPNLAPRPGPAPFIFLFVIDSLRHDYLSPYNPAVTFTPNLQALANDSLVFPNAFTVYGGTGMSLPSIWTGSAGLHRQYIKPFWPMNTLEKLLDANRFRRVMSVDIIMEQLLKPAEPPAELDRGRRTMDYELCRTLDELETKLTESASDPRPVFGYSLPQDLHVSNIVSAAVPAGEQYPGFHAPYAARVHRIDGCFGRFVEFLKRRGWYDRSVIVVTADHGEMLGEEGLWGHVYYLFPPVAQIPLIVHLPVGTPRPASLNPSSVSLTIDIAPTIYAALGYEPRRGTPLMGRPLVGPAAADPANEEQPDHVLAASYGAVWAALRQRGRRLYIVDAVQHKEYAYERTERSLAEARRAKADLPREPPENTRWASVPVTPGTREAGQRLIREHIYEVNRVYRATPRQ